MKKRYMWIVPVLILILGIAGCKEEEITEPEAPKSSEKEELLLWSYYETEAQKKGMDRLVEEFNDSQTEYEIAWEYVPMAEFTKNLSLASASDTLPDLVLVDNPDMGGLIKLGLLEDLTDEIEDRIAPEEFYEEAWSSVEYDKSCYGVPFSCNNTVIIYNKQMFREERLYPPKTWQDFKKAAIQLTRTGENVRYGFAMSAAGGEQGAFQLMPWVLATGIGTDELTDERGKEAFQLLGDLVEAGSVPNDCINWSQNDLTRSFVQGKVAMIENGPWSLPEIEKSGIDYGLCAIPAYATRGVVLGGENLAVIKDKNIAGAMAFIEFYNQEEVMEEISEIMRNIPPKVKMAKAYGEKNPEYQVFVDQMEDGVSRTSIKDWKKVCRAISDSLYQLFSSGSSIDEIWREYVSVLEEE